MTSTRRHFLQHSFAAASTAALSRSTWGRSHRGGYDDGANDPLTRTTSFDRTIPLYDPEIKALALGALDVAQSAGAHYADIRLTHSWIRRCDPRVSPYVIDEERMHVGIRALVNGHWGFAASPVWTIDEMQRLGREAVHQARSNALGKSHPIALAPRPVVQDAHWTMPVARDPFTVPPMEILDYLQALADYTERTPGIGVFKTASEFVMQDKAFAATDGCYLTQRLYRSSGILSFAGGKRPVSAGRLLDTLSPAGVGWELYTNPSPRERIRELIAEIQEDLTLPVKTIDVGRYDTLFDAQSIAAALSATLGIASELDRALGYEANAGGTSYLNDPATMIDTFPIGAPLLTVTADRTTPGGAATVRWDDEAAVPQSVPLVRQGILTGFQTSRENAGLLAEVSGASAIPVSGGSAHSPTGVDVPLVHCANLAMTPGTESLQENDLLKTLGKGIAVRTANYNMDFMQHNGLGLSSSVYDVKGGKRVARFASAGFLFKAPELWKSLLAIGGASSARRFGFAEEKGEPPQESYHSVTAVPALCKEINWVDTLRKA